MLEYTSMEYVVLYKKALLSVCREVRIGEDELEVGDELEFEEEEATPSSNFNEVSYKLVEKEWPEMAIALLELRDAERRARVLNGWEP